MVDDDVFLKFKDKKWSVNIGFAGQIYARAKWGKGNKSAYLHRIIMNCPEGKQVDHINRNSLDNRRENLRICSRGENAKNRKKGKNNKSGYKGVCQDKKTKKWVANISFGGKQYYLGLFKTKEKAYEAYCKKAKQWHGEFANLN